MDVTQFQFGPWRIRPGKSGRNAIPIRAMENKTRKSGRNAIPIRAIENKARKSGLNVIRFVLVRPTSPTRRSPLAHRRPRHPSPRKCRLPHPSRGCCLAPPLLLLARQEGPYCRRYGHNGRQQTSPNRQGAITPA